MLGVLLRPRLAPTIVARNPGQPSSVAFDDDPNTVASPGTNGGTTDDSAGAQGAITKGNPTRGTQANSVQGGGGWAGSGSGKGVGAGAGGGTGGKQGAAGCVWIVAELLT